MSRADLASLVRHVALAVVTITACTAADRFGPTEFGWKTIDPTPHSGIFVNRDQAVAWSKTGGTFRISRDRGNTWSTAVRPILANTTGPIGNDTPVQAVATTTESYVLGAAGMIYNSAGASVNAPWGISQCTRLAVSGNDVLACEEGAGVVTHLIRNGTKVTSLTGRIVFAFSGGVVTYDGKQAYAYDGQVVRSIQVVAPRATPPDSFPLATGPGGDVMRSADGSRWTLRNNALEQVAEMIKDTAILSYGHGNNGAGGAGCALVRDSGSGQSIVALYTLNGLDSSLNVDRETTSGLTSAPAAIASAGRDAFGWRFIEAGDGGLRIVRTGGPRK